jgi:hypothetical protein
MGNAQAKRGKLPFAALPKPNRSRERVFRPLPHQSCFGNPFGIASPKTASEAAGEAVPNGPVAFDEIYNFIVKRFYILSHLRSQIIDKLSRSQLAVFRSE